MSLIPEFKIGVWNNWILMLIFLLQPVFMIAIDKVLGNSGIMRKMGDWPTDRREQMGNLLYMVMELLLLVYSVFLPLKVGTAWFYAGIALYLIGWAMFIAVSVTASTTPFGQPFVSGIYRFSRHPGYFAQFIIFLGMALAAASWIFLLCAGVQWLSLGAFVEAEERNCVNAFGEPYKAYLQRTPRWIGIPRR